MDRLGRYEIRGLLGEGGFATVYDAWDPALGRDVALKALLPHLALDPDVRGRFLAEARALGRLRHPNIVTIHDVGEADGRPFYTMELIRGRTLAAVLTSGRRPAPREIVTVVQGLSSAIDYLHDAGIIHRDIKAANVMVDDAWRVVLMDFGIARTLDGTRHTRVGAVVGTPECMAPEQILGRPVGPLADIYALGVLTYQMLAGRPPFVGATLHVMHAHAYEPPPPLRDLCPGLPEPAYAAVEAALAKDPERRPTRAAVFASLLSSALGGTGGIHGTPSYRSVPPPAWEAPHDEDSAASARVSFAGYPPEHGAPVHDAAPVGRYDPAAAERRAARSRQVDRDEPLPTGGSAAFVHTPPSPAPAPRMATERGSTSGRRTAVIVLAIIAVVLMLVLAALLIFLVADVRAAPLGSIDTSATVTVLRVDDTAYPDVALTLLARRDGAVLAPLEREWLRVEDDLGRGAAVTAIASGPEVSVPTTVILVLDSSTAMTAGLGSGETNKLDGVRRAGIALLDALRPGVEGDAAGLIAVHAADATRIAPATDHALVRARLDELTAGGEPASLERFTRTARDELARARPGPGAAIILADARAGAGSTDAGGDGIIVVRLLSDTPGDDGWLLGGAAQVARHEQELHRLLTEVATALHGQQRVTIRADAPADDEKRTLTLAVSLPPDASAGIATVSVTAHRTAPAISVGVARAGGELVPASVDAVLDLDAPGELVVEVMAPGGPPLVQFFRPWHPEPLTGHFISHRESLDPRMLAAGEYLLVVDVEDVAGNRATRLVFLRVPPLPPLVRVSGLDATLPSRGTVMVRPEILSRQAPIRDVTYRLDDRAPETAVPPDFAYALRTDILTPGLHVLQVTVTDMNEQVTVVEAAFHIGGASLSGRLVTLVAAVAAVMALAMVAAARRHVRRMGQR